MHAKQLYAVLICLVILDANLVAAPGKLAELKLRWPDLSKTVSNHRITLALVSGSTVEGNVISVGADSIEMDVRKTSNKDTNPKGKHTYTRAQFTTLDLQSKVFKGRGIALGVGAGIIGSTLGIAVAMQSWDSIAVAGIGFIAGVCVMVGGYFFANEHDRRLTRITILAD